MGGNLEESVAIHDNARRLLRSGKKAEARGEYLRALEKMPDGDDIGLKATTQSEIGKELFDAGFKGEGREIIKKALLLALGEQCKDDGRRQYSAIWISTISVRAAHAGLKKEAEEGFGSALERAGKISWGSTRSETQERIIREMASAGFAEEAMKLAPTFKGDYARANIYQDIVVSYAERGEFAKAIELIPKLAPSKGIVGKLANDEKGRIPYAWRRIAEQQAKRGMENEAKESFEKSVSLSPLTQEGMHNMIEVAEKMTEAGFRKEAAGAFKKAIDAALAVGTMSEKIASVDYIRQMQKKNGFDKETRETWNLIEKLRKMQGGDGGGEPGIPDYFRILDILLVCALLLAMFLVAANSSVISAHIDAGLALTLAFGLPLVFGAVLYGMQLQVSLRILKGVAGMIIFWLAPSFLAATMFIVMVAIAYPLSLSFVPTLISNGMVAPLAFLAIMPTAAIAITFVHMRMIYSNRGEGEKSTIFDKIAIVAAALSFIVAALVAGGSCSSLMEAVGASVILSFLPPLALNLFVIGDIIINLSPRYSGVVVFFLPVLYLLFAIIGAALGTVGFLLFG